MHLESEKCPKFQRVLLFTLKRNLIIFAGGIAVILSAIALPLYYQKPMKKFTESFHQTEYIEKKKKKRGYPNTL